ncbi:hypothetical protein VB715_18575 [Crocosphaera sp. UHCC 0190]|nr:hypothetical protein [Crocosphaera sp. UHCC 0190]MEA5511781.1 hypothetical protein [Crocosphaera sp. UHCC 0190]
MNILAAQLRSVPPLRPAGYRYRKLLVRRAGVPGYEGSCSSWL